jgi:hypothetical protein
MFNLGPLIILLALTTLEAAAGNVPQILFKLEKSSEFWKIVQGLCRS